MRKNDRVIVGLRIKPPGIVDAATPHADMVFWKHTNKEIYDEFVYPHSSGADFSTIFTYGRTGSGKTYTMFGDENMPGIAELMLMDILKSRDVLTVRCTEIYNEVATDLFTGTPIRIVQENNAIRIISETQTVIKSIKGIKSLLKTVDIKRKTSETEHNVNSSRSHTVIEINAMNLSVNLVDLAGNEKMAEDLERRKEGLMINKSLLTLGKVIDQLHTDTQHVSYRESKLTRILQNTLSYGRIICLCTVLDLSDHLTIKFARRLKRIKTLEKPILKSKDEIIHDLTQRIAYLTEQIISMQQKPSVKTPQHVEAVQQSELLEESFESLDKEQQVSGESSKPHDKTENSEALEVQEEKQQLVTANSVIESMSAQSQANLCANLYEIMYKHLKVEMTHEMSNTLTPQEMNQVQVTVTKQKKGILRGTPFHSIFKLSRAETRSRKDND